MLLSLILIASTSLVAAAPLLHHDASAPAASSGGDWRHSAPTYSVAFQESGLPSGTYWSVRVVSVTAFWGYYSNSSTNSSSIGFLLSNGTYNFTIGSGWNFSGLYDPTPSSGQFTVDGVAQTVDIAFAAPYLNSLSFSETGLPSGTFWSVSVASNAPGWGGYGGGGPSPYCFGLSYWNGSINATIGFEVPNGSFSFSVGNVTTAAALYVPTPTVGNVTVNGTEETVDVAFAAVPLYNVTFDETGLPASPPNGTAWSVQLWNASVGGYYNASGNTSIGFSLPDGVYNFTVGNVTTATALYVPTPMSGVVTVNGSAMTVDILFAPVALYSLSFVESGLPAGYLWYAGIYDNTTGELFGASANSTIGFEVPNGTYNFTVGTYFLYPYPVTVFPQTVSPSCWNGTHNGSGPQYIATPASGTVTVNGTSATVQIAFAPLTLETVTFVESGLPSGTFWSVQLSGNSSGWGWGGFDNAGVAPLCFGGGSWGGSNGTTVQFTVPEGTYGFTILNVSGNGTLYVPNPASGTVTLDGSNVTVTVSFSAVTLYNLSFVETGLPSGSFWFVQLSGPSGWSFGGSTNSTISFWVPNGTYNYSVGSAYVDAFPSGPTPFCFNGTTGTGQYLPTPQSGNVTVQGSNEQVNIHFAQLTFYTVTFQETGLPNGTFWWVSLGSGAFPAHGWATPAVAPLWGGWNNGSSRWTWNLTSLEFNLPNGTYNFTVFNATSGNTTYVPTPASGTVTVAGANVTVTISFAAGGDPPTGGHVAAQGPRAADGAPSLGMVGAAGIAAGLLAALGVGLALVWRHRSAASKNRGTPVPPPAAEAPETPGPK